MKKNLAIVGTFCAITLLAACNTAPKNSLAIQNANNEYEVTGLGKSQVIAKNNAIAAANKTCGQRATPILIHEKSEFNGALKGVVDDKTGQVINAAAGVIGSVLGTGNSLEKDTDYQHSLTFKCQS
ncbi:hypothetical protein [Acinetobacter larvae]|uniref:Uncharacterized protein n=1 Tax=Acinetobacter larvae TaxID=1789224 RepID=A0A1B2LYS0_9GAMM|nr:hypothetical protein [Acinetobacter larvae]AOA58071.1 hypothetical protein BFG52_06705 [Acinetobacter larvae]